jgi:hypothetical protein
LARRNGFGNVPVSRDRAEGEVEIMLAARPKKITFGEMRDDMGRASEHLA